MSKDKNTPPPKPTERPFPPQPKPETGADSHPIKTR